MKFMFSDSGRVWEPRAIGGLFRFVSAPPKIRSGFPLLVLAVASMMLLWMIAPAVRAQGVGLDTGIFNAIADSYLNEAKTWEEGFRNIARSLFGGLAVISLSWTFIKLVLQKDDAKAFIPTMAMQILTLGFFYYLVDHGTEIAYMVIASFERSASRVAATGSLDPSLVVQTGFECVFIIMDKIGDAGVTEMFAVALPLVIGGIIILLAHVGVAILFLVTLIESYFVLYAGVIMLGFGALPWTREIPKNYLIYAINVGVKIFVLYLVVGVGIRFSDNWPAMLSQGTASDIIPATLFIMSAALVFAAVAWKVPGIAAALTSGSLNFNAGDAMGVTASAAGAGAAAGAVVSGGASSLLAATQGAMQATTSGMSLASEKGSSGAAALLKGLGHAAGATASEASSALKAKAGIKPPSLHSQDARGRGVDNLGTRAANNLQSQIQGEREARAGAPAVGNGPANGTAGNSAAGSGSNPSGPSGGTVQGGNTASAQPTVQGGSTSGPQATVQGASAGSPPNNAGVSSASGSSPGAAPFASAESTMPADDLAAHTDAKSEGRLKAPVLPPPDAAQGSVTINLGQED